MKRSIALKAACAGLFLGASAMAETNRLTGTFVQFYPNLERKSSGEWREDLENMRAVGIDTVVVQWSADNSNAYFRTELPYPEQHPVLDPLMEAVSGSGMKVYLGLENDTNYWTQIRGRDRVLIDYFLIRVAHNVRLQKDLIERFGDSPEWVGYYIPDEIDDFTWRRPDRTVFMRDYLALMTRHLRTNDPDRVVAVSAFFRGRTAPDIFAANMRALTVNPSNQVDHLLLQDGVGVGDPPLHYVPIYFREFRDSWPAEGPQVWGVIEAFQQVSGEAEPFQAITAAPERVRAQIEAAAPYCRKLVLFSFLDYVDPKSENNQAARDLYQSMRGKP